MKCAAEGCDVHLVPGLLMCRKHWFVVPQDIRARVWETYREFGIFNDAYRFARQLAIDSVAAKEASTR